MEFNFFQTWSSAAQVNGTHMLAKALCMRETNHSVVSPYFASVIFFDGYLRKPMAANHCRNCTFLPSSKPHGETNQWRCRKLSYQPDPQPLDRIDFFMAYLLQTWLLSVVTLLDRLFLCVSCRELCPVLRVSLPTLQDFPFLFCFCCFPSATHFFRLSNNAIPPRLSSELHEHDPRQLLNRLRFWVSNYLISLLPTRRFA